MEKTLVWSAIVGGLVVAVIGGIFLYSAPHLSGSFAGGVTPNQLWSADPSSQTVTPINGYGIYTPGPVSVGGTNLYNQVVAVYTASSSFTPGVLLGPIGSVTSTATSTFSMPANATSGFSVVALQVGDPCEGGVNTSTVAVMGCNITAVGGGNATGTFIYGNLLNSIQTVTTTVIFRFKVSHLPY